jgi:hypothetical protein
MLASACLAAVAIGAKLAKAVYLFWHAGVLDNYAAMLAIKNVAGQGAENLVLPRTSD